MMLLLIQEVGFKIPEEFEKLPFFIYGAAVLWILNIISSNKIIVSMWEDILKPRLINKGVIDYEAAKNEIDNLVTLSNAMDSIGYHYYFIARKLIDLAFTLNRYGDDRLTIHESYLRNRISSDIQRTKRLLGSKHLSNGLSLSKHLNSFSDNKENIVEFYAPITEALRKNLREPELRDVVLKQVDILYSQAEKFYQDNSIKN